MGNGGTGEDSAAVTAKNSLMFFYEHSDTRINSNIGTAMTVLNSKVFFKGTILFANNSGSYGGAIHIKYDSLISFGPLSKSTFIDNVVSVQGGAVYSSVTKYCTFDASSIVGADQVYFASNYANLIEQSIYIENTTQCNQSSEDFRSKFQFVPPVETQVLFRLYTVDISLDVRRVMLGEKFNLKSTMMLVSVGTGYLRFHSASPSNITEAYNMRGPSIIILDRYSNNLEFFVVGPEITQDTGATIDLYYKRESYRSYRVYKAEINFHLVKCQLGYKYSHEKQMCVCEDKSPNDFFQCYPH